MEDGELECGVEEECAKETELECLELDLISTEEGREECVELR
jgi:hypothetical protein